METLKRHAPVHVQDRGQKVMEIAVKFEEKMYNAAKSQDDYLKKISLKMLKMETNYQNPLTNSLHPNTASSGLNAHGQEMTMEATSYEATSGPEDSDKEAMEEEDGNVSKEDVVEEVVVRKEQTLLLGTEVMSELGKMRNLAPTKLLGGLQYFSIKRTPLDSSTQMGNANGADRQEELYQKIKSMKEMYLSELNDIYQKISSKVQQAQGGGEGAGAAAGDMDSGDWRTGLVLYTRQRIVNRIMEDIKRHFPVVGQDRVQGDIREIAVSFEEKMYNVATSWNDYVSKICFKMLTMTKALHPNTASSGQNAHGPEMTMEATSYETTSGPENSDEEATKEDYGDVSKEDFVEEMVVRKEQNYVVGVGHKENVRVGENERQNLPAVDESKNIANVPWNFQ